MESVNIDKPKPMTLWEIISPLFQFYALLLSFFCAILWIPGAIMVWLLRGESPEEFDFKQWHKSAVTICLLVMSITVVLTTALGFHTLVQYRVWRGDFGATIKGTEGYSARAAYERALAESKAYSNKFMNYNQAKMDEWNNMDKWDKEDNHMPVWTMRNFPEATHELAEEARENYVRVMEEENYHQQGNMPDRLFWAKNFLTRAEVATKRKYDYSDYYKTVTLKGIYKELPYEPSW